MAVVCAGEVLFDRWPDGTGFPGGAPANVAFHAAGLGAETFLISRTGDDPAGRRLREWLRGAGVDTAHCPADPARPTGTVTVDPDSAGGPCYDIYGPAAWDFIAADAAALDLARRARVLVIGTLAQRHPVSRGAIRELAAVAGRGGARVLADLNLRAPFHDEEILLWTLRHCGVLKLNRDELAGISRLLGAAGDEKDLFSGLLREFAIPCGVLTAGADGAWIHEDGSRTSPRWRSKQSIRWGRVMLSARPWRPDWIAVEPCVKPLRKRRAWPLWSSHAAGRLRRRVPEPLRAAGPGAAN